jgi:hypothetical protein
LEDPRRAIVEVMARLGRETQLHIDERHRHFRITDGVTIAISVLLVILAVFNVYYVRVLYSDLDGTVASMENMYNKLRDVDDDMLVITQRVARFDRHIAHMEQIQNNMGSIAVTLPSVRDSMDVLTGRMSVINEEMNMVRQAMANMDPRLQQMSSGVSIMRANTFQIAKPMGMMNQILP